MLRDGGKIIPARFDLYMEPVQLKEEFRVPFIWDNKYPNADYACLKELWRERAQPPNIVRSIRPYEIDYLLTDPEKLYSCDIQTMGKDDMPKEFRARRTVQRDGRLDGFCLFFTVALRRRQRVQHVSRLQADALVDAEFPRRADERAGRATCSTSG